MTPHWRWEAQKRSTFLSPTGLLVVRALFPYWAVETYVCRKCRRIKLLSQLSEEEILCLVNEAPCYISPFRLSDHPVIFVVWKFFTCRSKSGPSALYLWHGKRRTGYGGECRYWWIIDASCRIRYPTENPPVRSTEYSTSISVGSPFRALCVTRYPRSSLLLSEGRDSTSAANRLNLVKSVFHYWLFKSRWLMNIASNQILYRSIRSLAPAARRNRRY